MIDEEIEKWIDQNKVEGKLSVLKITRPEPDYPEYTYQVRLEGKRYGQLGIVELDDDPRYQVVIVKTGEPCGLPFSSESQAERLVFCVRGLTDWRKAKLSDWTKVISEACAYCRGLKAVPQHLLNYVRFKKPSEERDVEEFSTDSSPVPFGESHMAVSKPKKVVDSEWGTATT